MRFYGSGAKSDIMNLKVYLHYQQLVATKRAAINGKKRKVPMPVMINAVKAICRRQHNEEYEKTLDVVKREIYEWSIKPDGDITPM